MPHGQLATKDRLKALVTGSTRPLGGHLQFLGLDEVQARLGDRWEKKKEFIRSLCQRTVRPHIGGTDICLEYGELGFVILFGELDDEAATLKCGLIKAEIMRQILGDSELSDLRIQTSVGDLASGETSQANLLGLIEKVVSGQPAGSGAGFEAAKLATPQANDDSPVRIIEKRQSQGYGSELAQWATIKSALKQNADPFALDVDFGEPHLKEVDFGFLPLLNRKNGIISLFHCTAVRLDSFDRIINGHDVLPEDVNDMVTVDLDQLTLARAKIGLMDMAMRKRIALVSAPISHATLSRPQARQAYIAALRSIPVELQRYLVIKLTEFPEGVPPSTLGEFAHLLKQHSRGLSARVQPTTQSFAALREAGIQIVGFKFPESEPVSSKMFLTMSQFKQNAARHKLGTFVRNLKTKELVRAAIDLGYDYIGGPAIVDISDYVGPVREIDLSNY